LPSRTRSNWIFEHDSVDIVSTVDVALRDPLVLAGDERVSRRSYPLL
jgi:hypothetical protein